MDKTPINKLSDEEIERLYMEEAEHQTGLSFTNIINELARRTQAKQMKQLT